MNEATSISCSGYDKRGTAIILASRAILLHQFVKQSLNGLVHKKVAQNNGNITDTLNFFINMVLDHLLRSIQTPFFLEWTQTSFVQSLAEFYTILLEDHLQVALEMLEVGIYSMLIFAQPRLTAVGIRCADHATPLPAKVGTNFADKRRSLGRYSSLADYGHGV
jgi:hypothetical protein